MASSVPKSIRKSSIGERESALLSCSFWIIDRIWWVALVSMEKYVVGYYSEERE